MAGLDLSVLSPYGDMNRGEVAQVLHNLLGKLGSGGDYHHSADDHHHAAVDDHDDRPVEPPPLQ